MLTAQGGSFHIAEPSPASPTPQAALGHQTPHPERSKGNAWGRLVWAEERAGATQRDGEGRGVQVPSHSLSGTDGIHIRCSVIKSR